MNQRERRLLTPAIDVRRATRTIHKVQPRRRGASDSLIAAKLSGIARRFVSNVMMSLHRLTAESDVIAQQQWKNPPWTPELSVNAYHSFVPSTTQVYVRFSTDQKMP
jgi:hypothetical protein